MKSFTALLVLLGALCIPVLGQSTPPSKAGYQTSAEPAQFDFNFPGGTLPEFLKALSAVDPMPINITVDGNADEIKVPKLVLVSVRTDEILESLARIAEPDGSFANWKRTGRNIWVVGNRDFDRPQTGVVYVGQLLKKYKIEDIAAAITFALDSPSRPKQAPPKLRLHKETSLLIFEVQPRDFPTVMQVLQQLKESAAN